MHIDPIVRSKLDAKSKKSFFVGYGDFEFGYRLWGDQNWKIIRSKDVIFNEAILYKDRDSSSEAKKLEVISLKDLPKTKEENSGTKDQETEVPEESQTTLIVALRRSSRAIKPPQRYFLLAF